MMIFQKHMIPNVYVNNGKNILTGSDFQINSSIRFFPIPQEMIFQVARKAKNIAAHLCSLSVRAVQGALQGIERDARQPS